MGMTQKLPAIAYNMLEKMVSISKKGEHDAGANSVIMVVLDNTKRHALEWK